MEGMEMEPVKTERAVLEVKDKKDRG